ncbi:hypothetical protein STEG23_028281 [Scotinomys teguina]
MELENIILSKAAVTEMEDALVVCLNWSISFHQNELHKGTALAFGSLLYLQQLTQLLFLGTLKGLLNGSNSKLKEETGKQGEEEEKPVEEERQKEGEKQKKEEPEDEEAKQEEKEEGKGEEREEDGEEEQEQEE